MKLQEFVSDKIKLKDIEAMTPEKLVLIGCPMGTGKSHFIKNDLHDYCADNFKSILFIVHRVILKKQNKFEIKEENKDLTITTITYQSLLSEHCVDLGKYDYIVCDECHDLLVSSSYNHYTDIYLKKILSQTHAVKIFMSATIKSFARYLVKEKNFDVKPYTIKADYNFSSFSFYNKDSSLHDIIEWHFEMEEMGDDRKGIFFLESLELAYELYTTYKNRCDCSFVCSKFSKKYLKGSKELRKHIDDTIDYIVENEKFEGKFLFTTSAMDAGVNLKDEKLATIVVDMRNPETLVQCIGRKRIMHKNDHPEVYIKCMNGNEIKGLMKPISERIAIAKEFIELDKQGKQNEFIQKYHRINHKMIYPCIDDKNKLELNELMHYADKETLKTYYEMIYPDAKVDENGKWDKGEMHFFGYSDYIANLFGRKSGSYGVEEHETDDEWCFSSSVSMTVEDKVKAKTISEYLEEIVDIALFKEDKKLLIEKIDYRFDGHVIKDRNKINKEFEIHGIKYFIDIDTDSETRRKFWVVNRI